MIVLPRWHPQRHVEHVYFFLFHRGVQPICFPRTNAKFRRTGKRTYLQVNRGASINELRRQNRLGTQASRRSPAPSSARRTTFVTAVHGPSDRPFMFASPRSAIHGVSAKPQRFSHCGRFIGRCPERRRPVAEAHVEVPLASSVDVSLPGYH
jgi:hypothetical protein